MEQETHSVARSISYKILKILRDKKYHLSVDGAMIRIDKSEKTAAVLCLKYEGSSQRWSIKSLDNSNLEELCSLAEQMENAGKEASESAGFPINGWKGIAVLDKDEKVYDKIYPKPKISRIDLVQISSERRNKIREIIYNSSVPLTIKEITEKAGDELKNTVQADVYTLKNLGEIITAEKRIADGYTRSFYARKDYVPIKS